MKYGETINVINEKVVAASNHLTFPALATQFHVFASSSD